MNAGFKKLWTEEDGVLSFDWTLLLTLLVLGIVSGVAAVRDGIIDELGDCGSDDAGRGPVLHDRLSAELWTVHAVDGSSASDSSFTDALIYTDCDRDITLAGQNVGPIDDGLDGG